MTAPAAPGTTSAIDVPPTSTVTARSRIDWHVPLVVAGHFADPLQGARARIRGLFLPSDDQMQSFVEHVYESEHVYASLPPWNLTSCVGTCRQGGDVFIPEVPHSQPRTLARFSK